MNNRHPFITTLYLPNERKQKFQYAELSDTVEPVCKAGKKNSELINILEITIHYFHPD